MALTACFFLTDLILAMRGCRLFPRKRIHKILDRVLMFIFMSRLFLSVYMDCRALLMFYSFNIYTVSNLSYIAFIVIFSISMHVKRNQYRVYFEKTLKVLPKHQNAYMSAVSLQNIIVFTAYLAAHMLAAIPLTAHNERWLYILSHLFLHKQDNSLNRLISGIAYSYEVLTMTMWIVVAYCLYNWAHVIKHLICLSLLDQMDVTLRQRPLSSFAVEQVIESVKTMRRIQEKFDQKFSFLSFLIFTCNFLQAPGYLIGQFITGSELLDLEARTQTIIFSILYLSVALILVLTVNKRYNELKDRSEQVLDLLSKSERNNAPIVAKRIEKAISKDTAWGLFTIENSLIASYAGHFLTFSVMFFQILPKS